MKKGEKMTPEHKEKILAGLQRAAAEGKLGRKKGTHVSEESKIKISNALRVRNGKKRMTAEERAQNIAEHQAKKAARESLKNARERQDSEWKRELVLMLRRKQISPANTELR